MIKDIQKVKDMVAKRHGFMSWNIMIEHCCKTNQPFIIQKFEHDVLEEYEPTDLLCSYEIFSRSWITFLLSIPFGDLYSRHVANKVCRVMIKLRELNSNE